MTGSTHEHGHTLDLVLSHGFTVCDIEISGGLVGGGVWLQSGFVCYILCCTEMTAE